MSQKTKGILCIITYAFFFAVMNVFVRMAGDLPSVQKSFFRNLVAIFFAAAVLLRAWKPEPRQGLRGMPRPRTEVRPGFRPEAPETKQTPRPDMRTRGRRSLPAA